MAPGKSPAFQFYPKDFMAGTATMSLQEVGAYMRLLCYAWDAGSVPNDGDERARILGCAKAQEREIWKKVGKKFVLSDGVYLNERMEEERRKQANYRRRQSDAGKASAATRRQPDSNHGSTTVDERLQPKSNSSSSSSSSSSGSGTDTGSLTTKHRSGVIVGAAEYARLQESFAFVGSILKVPHKLHAELLGKSGGAHREKELQGWYLDLNDQLEESGKGTGDVFEFLRPRHQSFAKLRGWVEEAPKNGVRQPSPDHVERMLAIERGERRR